MLVDLINPDKVRRATLYFLIMVLCLTVQNHLVPHLVLFGVRPMFLPVFAVAVGMFEGGLWGGVFGLLSGLLLDMSFTETTVLFTVLFPLLGFGAGMLAVFSVNRRFYSCLVISLGALLLTAGVQAALPVFFLGADPAEALFVAAMQALLSLPFTAAVYFPVRRVSGKRTG